MCQQCEQSQSETRWLALLLRQGLKLIVAGIEKRYGLGEESVSQSKEVRRAVMR